MAAMIYGEVVHVRVAAEDALYRAPVSETSAPTRRKRKVVEEQRVRIGFAVDDAASNEIAHVSADMPMDLARSLWHNLGNILRVQDDD